MEKNLGVVIFSFDHAANPDIRNYVLDAFKARGLKATLYTQTGLIGAKRWNSTVDDLRILYDCGWDISNHSISHARLGYLNEEAIEHEIKKSTEDLLNWGFHRSAMHFSYPESSHSQTSLDIAKKYCHTARLVTGRVGAIAPEGDDLYKLDCISMKAGEASEKAIKAMSEAVDKGMVAHIMFEMIFHENPPPQGYLYSEFLRILDFAQQLKLDGKAVVLNLSEWYEIFINKN